MKDFFDEKAIFLTTKTHCIDTYPSPNMEVLIAKNTLLCYIAQLKSNNTISVFLVGALSSNFNFSKLQIWAKTGDLVLVHGTLTSIIENPANFDLKQWNHHP